MKLTQLLQDIEQQAGSFSKKYKTKDTNNHSALTQDIPFDSKPAQQFLTQLGGTADNKAILSVRATDNELKNDIIIKSFTQKESGSQELKIAAQCINTLLDSAKIYINTSLFPAGLYAKAMREKLIVPQDTSLSKDANIHWQNLAVGVCHAQIVYPLVTIINKNGKSYSTAANDRIVKDAHGILLLSSPRLNFTDGVAQSLKKNQQVKYIEGMYRNLFHATVSEGRQYLAMPAAGLSASGGSYDTYFSALMTVAKEFPKLNIIYHPGKHIKEFDKVLKTWGLTNVARTTKDIVHVASLLTQKGHFCALHNPSDADVVYGLCDVGGSWKNKKNKPFAMQEYIGTMTTAPLNSAQFNPQAYQKIVETHLSTKHHKIPTKKAPDDVIAKPCVLEIEPTLELHPAKMESTSVLNGIESATTTPEILISTSLSRSIELPVQSKDISISSNPNSLFMETKKQLLSSLSHDDIKDINSMIICLQKEIDSVWPYPNKDVKQIKINALNQLKIKAETLPINEAIAEIKKEFPRVDEGKISTRTSDLLAILAKRSTNITLVETKVETI